MAHSSYRPWRKLSSIRTKPYEWRIDGIKARSEFQYSPFNHESEEVLLSGEMCALNRACTEVTHFTSALQKSVEYLKIDASVLGAISMSMNQGQSGQEKVFVLLKSALAKICDFRAVNMDTGGKSDRQEPQIL